VTEVVIDLLLGFGVGVLSGFLGVGGGVILVTVLAATGITQHEAQATALAFMVPTATVGLVAMRRKGLGDLRASAVLGVSGAVAAVGGSLLALSLPEEQLRVLFAAFIAIAGISMLWPRVAEPEGGGDERPRPSNG
jgi:uncharacterized membrane protein YfcA